MEQTQCSSNQTLDRRKWKRVRLTLNEFFGNFSIINTKHASANTNQNRIMQNVIRLCRQFLTVAAKGGVSFEPISYINCLHTHISFRCSTCTPHDLCSTIPCISNPIMQLALFESIWIHRIESVSMCGMKHLFYPRVIWSTVSSIVPAPLASLQIHWLIFIKQFRKRMLAASEGLCVAGLS